MAKLIPPRIAPSPDLVADDLPPEVAELLHFTPVVRQVNRPDGWNADRQRHFIVLLAETGSPQRAAVSMGKQLSGVEGVYRADEAGGFRAAWEQALAIGAARQRACEAEAAEARGERTDRDPPHRRGGGAHEPDGACDSERGDADCDDGDDIKMSEEDKLELFSNILRKYVRKVELEREARLAGRVVEADFTLRQITASRSRLSWPRSACATKWKNSSAVTCPTRARAAAAGVACAP